MRASNLPITEVIQISDFYKILEQFALSLAKEHEIVESWLRFKSLSKDNVEIQKSQWEIETFMFSFKGNKIFSFSTSNGKEVGDISEYPLLTELQVEAFDYIKERASSANSNILQARYNHILWKGVIGKNKQFAEAAIFHYRNAIQEYYKLVLNDDNDGNTFEIGRLYENLVSLANEINSGIDELKSLTTFLLFKDTKLPFYTKHGIIKDMLEYPKIFRAKEFQNTLALFELELPVAAERGDDFQLVNYLLPTAIEVAKKTNRNISRWHNEVGDAYIRMAEKEHVDERNWIKLELLSSAIDSYRKGGNIEKKTSTEQKYSQLKPLVKLDEYKVDFDEETISKIKAFQQELKEKARNLLKENPETVYSIIANGSFFPKYTDVLKTVNQNENNFLNGVTTVYFDNNKNITKPNKEDSEKYELLKTYGMRVSDTLLPFLHFVFVYGIKSGRLTARNFLEFLVHKTWIGKTTITYDLGGHPVQINWAKLIIPSITDFFNQVLAWGESKYYVPSFILCIDSLTLKIEGLFRSFSDRINISTSIGKKKGMQEALLHNILSNEVILKYFDEDDRLLFEYVFSEKGGLNLRNNVAHSFYSENQYQPDEMLLLLSVVLRLGKYNVKGASN